MSHLGRCPTHPALFQQRSELFATILGNAHNAGVQVNEHLGCCNDVREHLTKHRGDGDVETEEDLAACERTNQIWVCFWYSTSVGSYRWLAASYEDLIVKVTTAPHPEMLVTYAERMKKWDAQRQQGARGHKRRYQ